MAEKEKRGGVLRNSEIEEEINRTQSDDKGGRNYRGSQDTGEQIVREKGTSVQRNDGFPPDEIDNNQDGNENT